MMTHVIEEEAGPARKRPKVDEDDASEQVSELTDSTKSLRFGISERVNKNFGRFSGLVKNS